MALLVGGGDRTSNVPFESYLDGAFFENFDDAMAEAKARRSNSPPYRRETYFSERISQVCHVPLHPKMHGDSRVMLSSA